MGEWALNAARRGWQGRWGECLAVCGEVALHIKVCNKRLRRGPMGNQAEVFDSDQANLCKWNVSRQKNYFTHPRGPCRGTECARLSLMSSWSGWATRTPRDKRWQSRGETVRAQKTSFHEIQVWTAWEPVILILSLSSLALFCLWVVYFFHFHCFSFTVFDWGLTYLQTAHEPSFSRLMTSPHVHLQRGGRGGVFMFKWECGENKYCKPEGTGPSK